MTTFEKDNKVFNFVSSFIERHSYPPSIREICSAVGISSTATVHDCIARLIKGGRLVKPEGKKRAYEIVKKNAAKPTVTVPLVGKITAGTPIEAVENIEDLYPLPDGLFGKGELFMLNVEGDSMINAGIFDGDTIVVKQQQTAENGEIVAAMINGEATVKRFYKENKHFRLQPENDNMSPIITAEAEILGIVVGLIRKIN